MNDWNSGTIFEAQDLSYTYSGDIVGLSKVSFQIHKGETVALVGANGSGKSTLLKLMDGLVFPSDGQLLAFGQPLTEKALQDPDFVHQFRRRVGLVFQEPDVQLFSPTVWDEVTFGPLQLRISSAEANSMGQKALQLLGIEHLKERPPYLLSGGEKKKVALASVLALQPQVLLLDEPTNDLDPRGQGNLIDFLLGWSAQGSTLVFSTQDLDLVEEVANRVIVLGTEHGIVADGKPEEYLNDPDFLIRTNLDHEHSHRHKDIIHRHRHTPGHEHEQ